MRIGSYKNRIVLYDARHTRWLLFRRPVRIHSARHLKSVLRVLRAVEQEVAVKGLYAAGFIAYEAAPAFDEALSVRAPDSPDSFPLLWFGIYREPEPLAFPPLPPDPAAISWQASLSETEYQIALDKIKGYIRAGDSYQVNYSFRMRAPFSEDPWQFFVRMIHAQGYGYGAFIDTPDWAICSASPELFFLRDGEQLVSRPMKGTAARGLSYSEDLEKVRWLQRSEKNRAENVMIVDMVRNDMGRIAAVGSVQVPNLFAVEKYPTLWQMTSTVRCTTTARVTDIFRALFPAASITGAPKARTMQIITELENAPRRIYTGTIGFLAPQSRAQFNIAIRTVLVNKSSKTAEYGVGSGVVWDSETDAELQECYTKARILAQPLPEFDLLETLLWTPDGGYFLLDAHLDRLAASAAYFARPIDREAIHERLTALAYGFPPQAHRVRLRVPPGKEPVLEAQILSPGSRPYRVRLANRPTDSRDPFLYHKTTQRRVYEQALAGFPDYDDVLLWNRRGELTESCIANLVVELDGRLLTPPVSCGLLPGTYRALLLAQGKVSEAVLRIEDLPRCSRICLVNSVRGLWEIALAFGEGEHSPASFS